MRCRADQTKIRRLRRVATAEASCAEQSRSHQTESIEV
jgi:hypothetical protein